jgi:hypothetical protein
MGLVIEAGTLGDVLAVDERDPGRALADGRH